jgi:hypothetical protein
MERLDRFCVLMTLLPSSAVEAENDMFPITCPLNEATVAPAPKNQVRYDSPDYCIALVSLHDATVKAVTGGKVTHMVKNDEEDGIWDVVFSAKFNNKEYYFWYTGISRVIVKETML